MRPLQAQDIAAFLDSQRNKETVRFITCGSVDDGKSTLIGRLLFESKAIFDDQLASLARDSRQYGTQGERIDLALLVDGLQAEREQGITIDVAYRFFATDRRRFIVADTPGHEQYTRNMATGASTADLAVILVDARKGVLTQTRRHSRIAALMGIHHVVLAVNKMDLVHFSQATFEQVVADYRAFAAGFGFAGVQAIPLSGLEGDNVLQQSVHTPWYEGPSLMAYLDTVDVGDTRDRHAFRMPVQWVNRPNLDFRGFCGRVAEGRVRPGDAVRVLPSGVRTRVRSVIAGFEEVEVGHSGDAVTLTLADEVDASRGDVLVAADSPPEVADQFEARLLWLHEHAMSPGRPYLMKLATKEVTATVTAIKYREDVNTGAHLAARTLGLNEIAAVNLATSAPLVFEPYGVNRVLGSFILIDKLSFDTVGAGMIDFALRRASNIHWQALELSKATRAAQKHQRPQCIWFTGLSGSGKSTLANLLEKRLHAEGRHTYLLDGDNVRHGLNRDLGFTEADRVENIRRVAEVAKLMVDAGLIVLVSLISPFRSERRMARELFDAGEFVEVFVDTPIEECERRDVKGLYAKARMGALKNFTGIDSPYEVPEAPELRFLTTAIPPEACVEQILKHLG
ncbi:MAG TPA: sulfate adenylyltransferase subunit CysN [Rhodocyclaceae bacterium]|nr:sulfate adenylyltransferase subunit CysN [Rhodocyclaceae bacterium]